MNTLSSTVALSVEMNEGVYNYMQEFLNAHPQWNREMLIEASISSFLRSDGKDMHSKVDGKCPQVYEHSSCTNAEEYIQN